MTPSATLTHAEMSHNLLYRLANDVEKIYPMEYAFPLLNDEGHYLYFLHHIVSMQCMTHVLHICFEI